MKLDTLGMSYLATPYTNYAGGLQVAFEDAAKLAGELMMRGCFVFCPVSHGHPMSQFGGVPALSHALWLEYDKKVANKCDTLLVGKLKGWQESYGIGEEIKWFRETNRPVLYVDPASLQVSANP